MGIKSVVRYFGGVAYIFDKRFTRKHDADYRAWAKRQTGMKARVVKTKDGYSVYIKG